MRTKVERALYGPGLTEVVVGVALSFVVGALLAAAWLVLKPVAKVNALPKDPAAGTVYYLPGATNAAKGQQWLRKRQLFAEGSSVVLTEDELNAWVAGSKTAADKPPAGGAGASAPLIAAGAPNFRIRDGVFQIALPCTLNALGFSQAVLVQAMGGFVQEGGEFVFQPAKFYVGSCPLQDLPGASLLFRRFAALQEVPPEVAEAWKKLAGVSVEGDLLRLTMP